MTMWPTILLASAVLILIAIISIKKSAGIPVLEATAATQNGIIFEVCYRQLNSEFKPVEYVHLTLCLAAKILYIIPSSKREEANELLSCIDLLGNSRLEQTTNVLSLCGRGIIANELDGKIEGKKVKATLYYKNILQRNIKTSIPITWFEYQFLNSWLSILQTSLPKLDKILLEKLQGALKRMNSLYVDESLDFTTLEALVVVPSRAFIEAEVVI